MDLIKELYRLYGPFDQPTWPPLGHVAIYRDFFKRLMLLIHPFFREALLNLDVSLPQLNLNAVQSLVTLWVLYRINRFPDLTLEEFRAQYAMKNSPNCEGSYYFQSFSGQVITGRDDNNKTWKDYWFSVGGVWEAPPLSAEEVRYRPRGT